MEVNTMYGNTSEHHAINDELLPTLTLQPAVEVRIDIEETGVKLFIGPREYEWPRCCPDSLLSKDGVLHPGGWVRKRRFVSYPEQLHKYRCKAPAITKKQNQEHGMVD
jgi:hypothetical protein